MNLNDFVLAETSGACIVRCRPIFLSPVQAFRQFFLVLKFHVDCPAHLHAVKSALRQALRIRHHRLTKEQAFLWLEKLCQEHSYWAIYLKVVPTLVPLRSDPRFAGLLQRIGLPNSN